ncbi:Dihydropteroate synthase [[Actinomadura] parvosata subsp. kistnae]|nr:Dihydropteroate synthase [Actinomadura parvosata subsp. kistnae]
MIRQLSAEGVVVSVDTMRAEVARAAVEAGARIVNDVSGGLADPEMPRVVAATGVTYVVMHWRGHSHDMYSRAVYADVVTEVREELSKRVDLVLAEGVTEEQIVLDPGLGFARTPSTTGPCWRASAPGRAGLPAAHRGITQTFPGAAAGRSDGTPRPFSRSDDATLAVTALAAHAGAWCVRVHEVGPNADAVRVAAAWKRAGAGT